MNTKYAIATVVIIALIAAAAFIYVYYQGQPDEQIEALHNLIDDTGYKTSMDALPTKIISLAPSTTEILFALGLDDEVVAVSNFCDYPYNFSAWIADGNMSSIGDFSNPNMEVIATLEPERHQHALVPERVMRISRPPVPAFGVASGGEVIIVRGHETVIVGEIHAHCHADLLEVGLAHRPLRQIPRLPQ